jgi:hypothetical protein
MPRVARFGPGGPKLAPPPKGTMLCLHQIRRTVIKIMTFYCLVHLVTQYPSSPALVASLQCTIIILIKDANYAHVLHDLRNASFYSEKLNTFIRTGQSFIRRYVIKMLLPNMPPEIINTSKVGNYAFVIQLLRHNSKRHRAFWELLDDITYGGHVARHLDVLFRFISY